jgi:hypothetical protein
VDDYRKRRDLYSGKNVIRAEIDAVNYPEAEGSLDIQGGAFNGTMRIGSSITTAISGGKFSSDPVTM